MFKKVTLLNVILVIAGLLVGRPTFGHTIDTPEQSSENRQTSRSTIYLPLISQQEAPKTGIYLGAYIDPVTDYQGKLTAFEQQVGKKHAIYQYYTYWGLGTFVSGNHKTLIDQITRIGATPMLTWMSIPNSGSNPTGCDPSNGRSDPNWNLDSILNGSHDAYLRQFAQEVAAYPHTILMRWGHEMNLNNYSWAGYCNGRNTNKFILAYRHIVDIFRAEGANNVKWVWSPNYQSWPVETWNAYYNYYPGDDYVDWIGVVGYNWGRSRSDSGFEWDTFDSLYANFLADATARYPSKPIMLADYASVEDDGGDKAAWITDVFAKAKLYPNLRALVWHNYNPSWYSPPVKLSVDSSSDALAAYQRAIQDNYFLANNPFP